MGRMGNMSGCARSGKTTVSIDTPSESANLTKALRQAVNETLTNEWAMGIDSAELLENDPGSGRSVYEVSFMAVEGQGPLDHTVDEKLPGYKPGRFDKP
jgi:hypothetical protein